MIRRVKIPIDELSSGDEFLISLLENKRAKSVAGESVRPKEKQSMDSIRNALPKTVIIKRRKKKALTAIERKKLVQYLYINREVIACRDFSWRFF